MVYKNNGPRTIDRGPLIEGEDFYMEGAALVFTARYHLRRGSCCASGCRHCPYVDAPARAERAAEERERP